MNLLQEIPLYILIMVCSSSVLITGIGKAGFGGTIGVVAVPLMSLVMSPRQAAGIMLPILCVCDIFTVWHYRTIFDRRSLKILIPSGIMGVIGGAVLLGLLRDSTTLTKRMLEIIIGLIALAFIIYQVLGPALRRGNVMQSGNRRWGRILGWIGGFGSTLAHAGGPPVTMYLLARKLDRRVFVGTTAWTFTVFNYVKLVPYAAFGMLSFTNLKLSLFFMPLIPVGIYLGLFLNRCVSEKLFTFIIYLFLSLISFQLLSGGRLLEFFLVDFRLV
jgi:uncharacterized membrane protein YfcA